MREEENPTGDGLLRGSLEQLRGRSLGTSRTFGEVSGLGSIPNGSTTSTSLIIGLCQAPCQARRDNYAVIHVKVVGNRVTIVKEAGSSAEITVADDHVDISGNTVIRLEVDDVEVSIRKDSPQQSSLFVKPPVVEKQAPLRDSRGHFVKPPGALSSSDYIEQAVKRFGKPFKSVKEIMPLVWETDFQTTSKDPRNVVWSSIYADSRFVKTDKGLWALVEWLEPERQQVSSEDIGAGDETHNRNTENEDRLERSL